MITWALAWMTVRGVMDNGVILTIGILADMAIVLSIVAIIKGN